MGKPKKPPSHKGQEHEDTASAVQEKVRTKKPSMYKVVLLNDDYTPMEFVIDILELVFNKPHEEAVAIMMKVHQSGSAVCGIYSFEVAEAKASEVVAAARENQHPLQCKVEKG